MVASLSFVCVYERERQRHTGSETEKEKASFSLVMVSYQPGESLVSVYIFLKWHLPSLFLFFFSFSFFIKKINIKLVFKFIMEYDWKNRE